MLGDGAVTAFHVTRSYWIAEFTVLVIVDAVGESLDVVVEVLDTVGSWALVGTQSLSERSLPTRRQRCNGTGNPGLLLPALFSDLYGRKVMAKSRSTGANDSATTLVPNAVSGIASQHASAPALNRVCHATDHNQS